MRTRGRLALEELRDHEALAQYMRPLRQSHVPPPITPGAPARFLPGDLWQDVRYAARMFAKQPAFAAATILTLALGVGASTAIFSVVYGVILKPLPFHESEPPGRCESHRARPGHRFGQSRSGDVFHLSRQSARVRGDIGAWEENDVSITGRGDPEQVRGAVGQRWQALPLLRVLQPLHGRLFTKEDDSPTQPLRVDLTYPYWQRRFGGAENAVWSDAVDRQHAGEIIGILPVVHLHAPETRAVSSDAARSRDRDGHRIRLSRPSRG